MIRQNNEILEEVTMILKNGVQPLPSKEIINYLEEIKKNQETSIENQRQAQQLIDILNLYVVDISVKSDTQIQQTQNIYQAQLGSEKTLEEIVQLLRVQIQVLLENQNIQLETRDIIRKINSKIPRPHPCPCPVCPIPSRPLLASEICCQCKEKDFDETQFLMQRQCVNMPIFFLDK